MKSDRDFSVLCVPETSYHVTNTRFTLNRWWLKSKHNDFDLDGTCTFCCLESDWAKSIFNCEEQLGDVLYRGLNIDLTPDIPLLHEYCK